MRRMNVAGKLDNKVRNPAFLIWLSGGIGGVLPDLDHIPELMQGHRISVPVIGKLNIIIGVSQDGYGRPLHFLFLAVALVLIWCCLAHIGRRLKSGVLGVIE